MEKRGISTVLMVKAYGVRRRDTATGTNAPFVNKLHHLDPVFLEFLTPLFDRLSEK